MRVAGADLGKSGAVALIDNGKLVSVEDIQLDHREDIDAQWLLQRLLDWEPDWLVCEDCWRPKSLVHQVGAVKAVCALAGVDCAVTAVCTWKNHQLGRNTSDKKVSVSRAAELFPDAQLTRPGARKPSADRAEAILIGNYGNEIFNARSSRSARQ